MTTYRARRPYIPVQEEPEPIKKKVRNLNLETPGVVRMKMKEIAQKRLVEAERVAQHEDLEYNFALKVVDGQWCLDRALRETRRYRRKIARANLHRADPTPFGRRRTRPVAHALR